MNRVNGDSLLRNLDSLSNSTKATSVTQSNTRSGAIMPTMYIALADKYGQIVGT